MFAACLLMGALAQAAPSPDLAAWYHVRRHAAVGAVAGELVGSMSVGFLGGLFGAAVATQINRQQGFREGNPVPIFVGFLAGFGIGGVGGAVTGHKLAHGERVWTVIGAVLGVEVVGSLGIAFAETMNASPANTAIEGSLAVATLVGMPLAAGLAGYSVSKADRAWHGVAVLPTVRPDGAGLAVVAGF